MKHLTYQNLRVISKKQLAQINAIRFILPIVLFVIVAYYEIYEHWVSKGTFGFDFHLFSEVTFFGILGPSAVFFVLSYIIRLLEDQVNISADLDVLNRELEAKVDHRTEELQTRNLELAHANQELQQLDEMKSDFVSLVSHELRGPLTSLNGGLELALQQGEDLPPTSRRTLQVMARESQRLTRFVNEILDVSRLEAGSLRLSPGPVAVIPMLRRAVEIFCDCQDRPIHWEVPENVPPVWGDEIYLEKIVSNLLENAVKYSPKEGPIELVAQTNPEQVRISIRDHGPGISPELQDRIFERFHRLERGDRLSNQGWGLGLYFARMFAEAQGGKIEVQSPIHDDFQKPGTAFTVSFPITEDVPEDE
jgi:signal transduction histidine kinase